MSSILIPFYFVVTGLPPVAQAGAEGTKYVAEDSVEGLTLASFSWWLRIKSQASCALASTLPTKLSSLVSHYYLPRELDQGGYGCLYRISVWLHRWVSF